MPCNTPPPPPILEDLDDVIEDDPNELEYEFLPDELELVDDSALTFTSHTDSVLCCSFDKTGSLAVTGGQDEKAYVWYTGTGVVKFECPGHTESVISVHFNHDDSLVVTADMDGVVQVFDVASGTKVWNFDATEITWTEWHPTANILFAGTIDGSCWKWSVPGDDICSLFQTSGSGSSCGKLFDNGTKCAVGYMEGSIKVWDTENVQLIGSVTGKEAHESNVNCITCSSDGSLIATGSEDGTAKIIRSTNCRVLKTLQCSLSDEDKESIEGIGFLQGHTLLAVGTNDGNLRIFDVSTFVLRSLVSVSAPIVKLVCDEDQPLVYIASFGNIERYDARTAQMDKKWTGHDNRILDFVISGDKQKALSVADDTLCKIYVIR
ncbi:angio-associated migratory cell protein [Parasteatoda tepidariorum]|nr:angio-associated migratory cell protein [Parasteatoda tepidariorum]XP_015919417.1 angio-associated migratory cell protein [Parasteatoda tepidariorum]